MTAVYYPDCETTSPNSRFKLEARSPHNGTIPYEDGSLPTEVDFAFKYRQHQRNFRYRLLDRSDTWDNSDAGDDAATVVWERWQRKPEDSPSELIISDAGWSIIRTHGWSPEVIAIAPDGRLAVRVAIVSPKDSESGEEPQQTKRPDRSNGENVQSWFAEHLAWTTAGSFWTWNSWRYFLSSDHAAPHFVWHTWWGKRLVIDLPQGRVLTEEQQQAPPLQQAMRRQEADEARTLLAELAGRTAEIREQLSADDDEEEGDEEDEDDDDDFEDEQEQPSPLREKLWEAKAAILLVCIHRLTDCVPFLRSLEPLEISGSSSSAIGFKYWIERQYLRPILHHALRLLGEVPQGYPTYHFRGDRRRLPMPERIADRTKRTMEVGRSWTPEQVLELLGSPDFVNQRSRKVETHYVWSEDWEYYSLCDDYWSTFRITWEEVESEGTSHDDRTGKIINIETLPAAWLDGQARTAEILRT